MATRRWRRWKCAITVSLVACALAHPSRAAQPEAEHAAAVESFHRGTQLVEAGKLEEAIDAFRTALQHEPGSVGARLDLADCYEKIGSPASAWREYAIAESYARRENDPRQAMARASGGHLESRLLLVTLTGPKPEGMDLRVDGDPVGGEIVERGVLAVAPGQHRIEVTAPGKRPTSRTVSGAAGEARPLPIVFDEEPPPTALEQPGRAPSAQRTWGFVLGGVGLAGIAAGSIAGGVALSKRSSLETESHDPSVGSSRFYADRSSADGLATVSTVAFIAGGAALVGGLVLILTSPASSGRALRVVVGPGVGLGRGGGMTLGGAF